MPRPNTVVGFRASTRDLDWLGSDQFADAPAYCPTGKPDNDNDVLYSGSDDDAYKGGAEEREARYQAQERRYLDGKHMSLLSTSLMGPFQKSSGWVNPWRSKPAAAAKSATENRAAAAGPVAGVRKRKRQEIQPDKQTLGVQHGQESGHLVVAGAISNGVSSSATSFAAMRSTVVEFGSDQQTETSRPSRCALASSADDHDRAPTKKKHPYLDSKDLDRVQTWRCDVQTKAKLEARDRFSVGDEAAEMVSKRKRKGSQDDNWLRKQPARRVKSQHYPSLSPPAHESPAARFRRVPARSSSVQTRSRAAKAASSATSSTGAEHAASGQIHAQATRSSRRGRSSQQAPLDSFTCTSSLVLPSSAKQPEPSEDIPTPVIRQTQQPSESSSGDVLPADATGLSPHGLGVDLRQNQHEQVPSAKYGLAAAALGNSFTSSTPGPHTFTSPAGANEEPNQARRTRSSPPPASHRHDVRITRRSARQEHMRGSPGVVQDGLVSGKRQPQVADDEPSYHTQTDRSFRFRSRAPRRTQVSRTTAALDRQEAIRPKSREDRDGEPEAAEPKVFEAEPEVFEAVQDPQAATKTQRPNSDHPNTSAGVEEGSSQLENLAVDTGVSVDTGPKDQDLQDARPEPTQSENVAHPARDVATAHVNDVEAPPRLPEFEWLRSAIDFDRIPSPVLNLPALGSPAHDNHTSSSSSTTPSLKADTALGIEDDDQDIRTVNTQPIHITNVLSLMSRGREEDEDADSPSAIETPRASAVRNGVENLASNEPDVSAINGGGTLRNPAGSPHLPLSSPAIEGPTLVASQSSAESESSASSTSQMHASQVRGPIPEPAEDLQAQPHNSPANSLASQLCKQSPSQHSGLIDPETTTRTADDTVVVDDDGLKCISGTADEKAPSPADDFATNGLAHAGVAPETEDTTHQDLEPDATHKSSPLQPHSQTSHGAVQPCSTVLHPSEQQSPWTKPSQAAFASSPAYRAKSGEPPIENTPRRPPAESQACSVVLSSAVKAAKASTQSPWQRGGSQITAPTKPTQQLLLLHHSPSSPATSLSVLPSMNNYVTPAGRDQHGHVAMSQSVSGLDISHLCPKMPVPGQSSSPPSPGLSIFVQPLDDTATPDAPSMSKSDRDRRGAGDSMHQPSASSSPDPWRLPSTQYLLNRVNANPWSGRSSFKTGKRGKKRVSWLVPGDDETTINLAAEEANDAIQGEQHGSPCSNGKHVEKNKASTPHDHRPASPPPSLKSLSQLLGASQKFGKHFIAMTKGIKGLKRAAGGGGSSIPARRVRMRPAMLPSESQQTCNSPAVEAMAEKFIEADGQQPSPAGEGEEGLERTAEAPEVDAAEEGADQEDDGEGMSIDDVASDKSTKELVLGRWHSDSQMRSPDPINAAPAPPYSPPLVDVSLADVSAVMDNLDQFLESWNVEAEVARAKTDLAREEKERLERKRREEGEEDEEGVGSGVSDDDDGMVHDLGGMDTALGHGGGHGHRRPSQLAGLMDVGVWE